MKLVDVHCHLDDSRFSEDLDEVVSRFKRKGGEVLVTSGTNSFANRKVLEFSRRFDVVKSSFGLYPIDAIIGKFDGLADDYAREIPAFDVDLELAWIEENCDKCFCIGEIGLDFKIVKGHSQFDEIVLAQEEVFRKALGLAKKLDKVVVIHSRGAEERCIEILEEEGMSRVVMHCFGGKKGLIKRCVDNGWSFSVPAVITRLNHFESLVDKVPLGQLLTETDAPYLSPEVGTRNESANVHVTLERIAQIKGLDVKEVAEKIWENFSLLFDYKKNKN